MGKFGLVLWARESASTTLGFWAAQGCCKRRGRRRRLAEAYYLNLEQTAALAAANPPFERLYLRCCDF